MKNELIKITFLVLTSLLMGVSISSCAKEGEDGVDGTDGIDGQHAISNSGKAHLVLSGFITDAEASQIILDDLGTNTQTITIKSTKQLTKVDLSAFDEVLELRNITISDNSTLTKLIMPTIIEVKLNIEITRNDMLSEVSFDNLKRVDGLFRISKNASLTNILVPILDKIGDDFDINNNNLLKSIDLPVLKSIGRVFISDHDELTSIWFPELTTIPNGSKILVNPKLTDLSLPKLATTNGRLQIRENSSLKTFALPALNTINFTALDFSVNMLDVESVNGLLAQLVAITPSIRSKTIRLKQLPAAAPTGQGLTDKAILEASDNTVDTDL